MAAQPLRLLVLDDDPRVAERLGADARFAVIHCETAAAAAAALAGDAPDCALTRPPSVRELRRIAPELPLIALAGADGEHPPRGAQDEVPATTAGGDLLVRAVHYAMERKRGELALSHLALHDPLTGLPNRALLGDRIAQALARLPRSGRKLALLHLDLDGFKLVNDSLGHAAGDALLVQVADRLRPVMRPSDAVARLGADEFAVLCDELRPGAETEAIARRVREALADPFALGGGEHHVAVSIGIAVAAAGGSVEQLLHEAAAAMDAARRRGRDWEPYDATMRELVLHCQPQVTLGAGHPTGVEALVRWHHPERGLTPPTDFIGVAEACGPIVPEATGPVRVVVCDDAPAIRALMRHALERDGDVEIVGEAEDGDAVVELVADVRPDAVLLDLSMPKVDGLEALPRILAAAPWVGVVVLSGRDEAAAAPRALALGAERFMAKPARIEDIRAAVLDVGARAPAAPSA